MLERVLLCLFVATSSVNALVFREVAQFSAVGDCVVDAGRTAASVTTSYNRRSKTATITTNHLPNHNWECTNPNEPLATETTYTFTEPTILNDDAVYCLPRGLVGIAKNGVRIFNAKELEVLDCNEGHSDGDGFYHYHSLPDNGVVYDSNNKAPQFIGVALDGNPIYSAGWNTNLDALDICHGTYVNGQYRYITDLNNFSWFLGCFRSAPQVTTSASQGKCTGMQPGDVCLCQDGIVTFEKRSVSPKFGPMTLSKRNVCVGGYCGSGNGECGRNGKKNLSKKAAILEFLIRLMEK